MTENRKYWTDDSGEVEIVWDVVDGTEEVYFDLGDTKDIILSTKDYNKAERAYNNTIAYFN